MSKLITLAGAAMTLSVLATASIAQQDRSISQRDREAGRVTTSDQDGSSSAFNPNRAPDPGVGNNVSKGTDDRGTVTPPSRDRDVNDALKTTQ